MGKDQIRTMRGIFVKPSKWDMASLLAALRWVQKLLKRFWMTNTGTIPLAMLKRVKPSLPIIGLKGWLCT